MATVTSSQSGVSAVPIACRVESSVVHLADWLPTLLAATGLEAATGLDGLSMWDRLRDPNLPSPRSGTGGKYHLVITFSFLICVSRTEMVYNVNLFPALLNPDFDSWPPIAALRQGDWK